MLTTTLIEVPSWGNASLIELIWLLSGVLGIVFAVAGLPMARRLHRAGQRAMDPVSILSADGYLRRELIRIVQGAGIASIGIYASLQAPAIPGPVVTTPVGLLVTAVFLGVGLLNAAQSALDRRQQWRIKQLLET